MPSMPTLPAKRRTRPIELPERSEGQQTAIGAALEERLRREAGKRLLGVILLSDGAQRAYAPRDLPRNRRRPAETPRLSPVHPPVWPIARLGEAQDVAVKDLIVDPNVFVKTN